MNICFCMCVGVHAHITHRYVETFPMSVIKHCVQSNLREGFVWFTHHDHNLLSLREAKTGIPLGTWRKSSKDHGGVLLLGGSLWLTQFAFLYNPGSPAWGWNHSQWAETHYQKNAYGPVWWTHFLSWDSLFLANSILCQVDKKMNQHKAWGWLSGFISIHFYLFYSLSLRHGLSRSQIQSLQSSLLCGSPVSTSEATIMEGARCPAVIHEGSESSELWSPHLSAEYLNPWSISLALSHKS